MNARQTIQAAGQTFNGPPWAPVLIMPPVVTEQDEPDALERHLANAYDLGVAAEEWRARWKAAPQMPVGGEPALLEVVVSVNLAAARFQQHLDAVADIMTGRVAYAVHSGLPAPKLNRRVNAYLERHSETFKKATKTAGILAEIVFAYDQQQLQNVRRELAGKANWTGPAWLRFVPNAYLFYLDWGGYKRVLAQTYTDTQAEFAKNVEANLDWVIDKAVQKAIDAAKKIGEETFPWNVIIGGGVAVVALSVAVAWIASRFPPGPRTSR